jgi:hypothetical protein
MCSSILDLALECSDSHVLHPHQTLAFAQAIYQEIAGAMYPHLLLK